MMAFLLTRTCPACPQPPIEMELPPSGTIYSLVHVSVSSRFSEMPLLPWFLQSTHKMLKISSKWNFPAAWEKRVFCSLCTYIQLAHIDMLWEAESNTDAMPRISRWAGGGEKFYRLKTTGAGGEGGGQEPRVHDLAWPCAAEQICNFPGSQLFQMENAKSVKRAF